MPSSPAGRPGTMPSARPPMGFCLFGNVAIAAKRALDHHGLARVAVVDFDVHHGNGTQDLLWDEARALFCLHATRCRSIPAPARPTRAGAHGKILNLPLDAGDRRGGDARGPVSG